MVSFLFFSFLSLSLSLFIFIFKGDNLTETGWLFATNLGTRNFLFRSQS